MDSKKIILIIALSLIVSCKKVNSNFINKMSSDTLFVESGKHVDTLLLNVNKSSENIWFNKVVYSKTNNGKRFIIGSSLTHNNYITVSNIKNNLDVEILGQDPSIKIYKLKENDFITTEYSLYNYGILTKVYFSFLVNNKLQIVHKEKFELNSKDDGKTYDKEIKLINKKDTIYMEYFKPK